MSRPKGDGPINGADKRFLTIVAWAIAIACIGFWLWMPDPANSKAALLCTPDKKRCMKITLPGKGTCRWIHGYKVCK